MTSALSNVFFFIAGIGFLVLAKVKHTIQGYQTPKPFSLEETDRCIEYDRAMATRYLSNLANYNGASVRGKRILELGPGSDLGCGLLLIQEGATSYTGFDRFNLADRVPRDFYEHLARQVPVNLNALIDGRINYVAREDFDIQAGVEKEVDIVFSNAAFEHFDDVARVAEQLHDVVRPRGVLIAEIDLQTHSRWIRDADPNNIYRYPDWLYELLRFPGAPNRLRPEDYVACFESHGWVDIRIDPANQLHPRFGSYNVHSRFRGTNMDWLSIVFCARRAG